jgi:hypothetical protein
LGQDWFKASFILGPVFAVMLGASYYLYLDYKQDHSLDANEAQSREVFGTISFTDNNVRRKSNDSVLWNAVNRDDVVYYQDSIRTGPESYAVIKLKDNSIIELNENSLIVLEKNSNQLNVDFKTGDIRTKSTSKNLTIRVNDNVIQAQGADLKLRTDTHKAAQIVVTKGKAALVDSQKRRQELVPENLVNIDQRGQAQTMKIPLVLVSPADKSQIMNPLSEVKVTFYWTVVDKNLREEVLELSSNDTFSDSSTIRVKAHQTATTTVKRGRTFWRVGWTMQPVREPAQATSQLMYSETRSLQITEDRRLILLRPAQETTYELTPKENEIEFAWSSTLKPSSYLLELSDTSNFQRITQTHKASEPKLKISKLHPGRHYWRVTALSDKNENLTQSAPFNFEVRKTLPALPQLLKPDESFVWTSSLPVRLEWKKIENTSRYRVTVTRDREQKQILKSVTALSPLYSWPWTQPGSYYWSVESMDEANEPTTRSLVRTFTVKPSAEKNLITLTLPLDKAEVVRERKDPMEPVSFEWKADAISSANFTLMISKTPGFEKFLKTENIKKNRITVRLSESATYYWKVVWTDPTNAEHLETSSTNILQYSIAQGLPAPRLVSPIRNSLMKVPKVMPIELSWEPVESAAKYRVVLERFDDRINSRVPVMDKTVGAQKKVVKRDEPKEAKADANLPTTELPEKVELPEGDTSAENESLKTPDLPEGVYEWRVYTVDEKDIQGLPSEIRKLTVKMQEQLLAPKLKPLEIK